MEGEGGMTRTDDENRFEVASLTLEMAALVQRFLDGQATREELCSWAHTVQKVHEGSVFVHNGAADALHPCLGNLDDKMPNTEEPVVRRVELVDHLHAVRCGEPRPDPDEIATLTLTPHAIAARTEAQVIRVPVEGLGWLEAVRFASPATGRCFVAAARWRDSEHAGSVVHTYRYPASEDERLRVLSDLLDTLGIDMDETLWSSCSPLGRWRLMRADDNGNAAVVATFTGYAKARAQLETYEKKAHKQTYWLDAE
jgi:hypothetical protein